MAVMNMIAKLIREWTRVSALQTSLFRAFAMCFSSFSFCKVFKIDPLLIPKPIAGSFVGRCFFGYISVTCMFLAIFMLPFSLAMVLNFTQPVSAAAINFIFGGERLGTFEYVSIMFAMLGVVIMSYPSAVFWWIDGERGFDMDEYPMFNWGIVSALSGSIGSGFAYLMMRRMGQNIDSAINPLYFGLFSIWTGMFMIWAFDDTLVEEFDWLAVGLLVVMGFFGWVAQVGVTKAVSMDKAGRVAALNYI